VEESLPVAEVIGELVQYALVAGVLLVAIAAVAVVLVSQVSRCSPQDAADAIATVVASVIRGHSPERGPSTPGEPDYTEQ
jgi:hypothetical protein